MKIFDIFKILRIVFDFLSLILGFILSYWFRFYGGVIPIFHFPIPDFRHYFYAFTIVFFIALFVFYFTDLWKVEEKGFSFLDEVFEVLRALIILGIITTGISFFYRKILYARLVVIFFFLFTFILMLFFRGIIRILKKEFLKKGKGILRVLLIGEGEIGEWIERKIEEDKTLGYRIESNLSSEDFLKMDFKEFFYDLILIALPLEKQYLLKDIIKKCENFEIPIRIVPDIYQLMIGGAGIYNLAGMPILAIKEPRLTRFQAFLKRAFDLFFSLFIIILTLPIMAIIAILIKIQDKGPVFYLQERVGQVGKIFKLIKFRTMKVGADKEEKPKFTTPDDPRVTKIGRFLRKYSLDELPQFFNVLKGDMSVVGPRPERPYFVEKFSKEIPRYLERHRFKSGITGWAQVNGLRGDTPIDERVRYDLYYINNWSIWFDIKIIIKTILTFFSQKHAY